jgi:hypothetical protein
VNGPCPRGTQTLGHVERSLQLLCVLLLSLVAIGSTTVADRAAAITSVSLSPIPVAAGYNYDGVTQLPMAAHDASTLMGSVGAGNPRRSAVPDSLALSDAASRFAAEGDGSGLAGVRSVLSDDTGAVGPGVGDLKFARRIGLDVNNPAVVDRSRTVQEFIS